MIAKLSEVFTLIRNGASIKQSDGATGFPITRIETISAGSIDRNRMGYANITDICKYADYLLQDGDILMSHINSEKHLGKTAIYAPLENEQIIHGMNLLVLRANSSVLVPKYACYYFNSSAFLSQIPRITKKSVNQASFNVSALKDLTIPICPFEKQREIIKTLDTVCSLIQDHETQLQKLDELVKSRFIELFGDPQFLHHSEPLGNFLEEITYGFTSPMPDADTGPWKITAKDVVDGKINLDTARKTTSEAFDGLTAKCKPLLGDVLLTKDGTLGRTAIVDIENICVNQSIAVLRCNNRINPRFLMILLQMPAYQKEMLDNAGGGTIKHIYITRVDKMEIYVPRHEEQSDFLSFVEQTDKLKLAVKQSLEKLETLKKSLMQEYFG